VKQAVFDGDGGRCVERGSAEQIEFDHIIPYSRGGADTVGNLQVLCRRCNRRKGARL
jgi:5-methylcytosine-specific restriction endonuclease McrA